MLWVCRESRVEHFAHFGVGTAESGVAPADTHSIVVRAFKGEGPTGATGPQGAAGPTGAAGATGAAGPTGIGGYGITITNPINNDVLMYQNSIWVNIPQTSIADGGSY